MPIQTQPPETDLRIPLPRDGEVMHHHTLHAYYFGFCVPDAQIGALVKFNYRPAFGLCAGGVMIWEGMDNLRPLDMAFVDHEYTMPWAPFEGNTITLANGLRAEFIEPGVKVRVSYDSGDGAMSFDVVQTAIMPQLARAHGMIGEERYKEQHKRFAPGGMEQYMRCTGELILHGKRYEVDCYACRDRSWNQVRSESRGATVGLPPLCWSPICFEGELMFDAFSIEALDTDPAWKGLYDLPPDTPSHYFGWVYSDGKAREITWMRRNVLEYNPRTFGAIKQEIEAVDEDGRRYFFKGESICQAPMFHIWANIMSYNNIYRWVDEQGRVSYDSCEEGWWAVYARAMRQRYRTAKGA